jgi:hypothetical protein
MELFEAIQKRYSCRAYQNQPVESEKLEKILNAGRLAFKPCGSFLMTVFFSIFLRTGMVVSSECPEQVIGT